MKKISASSLLLLPGCVICANYSSLVFFFFSGIKGVIFFLLFHLSARNTGCSPLLWFCGFPPLLFFRGRVVDFVFKYRLSEVRSKKEAIGSKTEGD